MTAIVWLRRDLRVHDHPALHAALAEHERVLPVFCLDERLLRGRHASGPRTQFLLECLSDLDDTMRTRGGGLVLRKGPPERELAQLARETKADAVHFTTDVTPFARKRGVRVRSALKEAGVELHGHPGLGAIDDVAAPRTQGGKPYTIFTPFHRNWEGQPRRAALGAPRKLPPLPSRLAKGRLPALEALGLEQQVSAPARGGETQGRARLARFLEADVRSYGQGRDALGEESTSRLSPYLHFGCVSPRELETRLPGGGEGPEAFRRQLCWRDFHHHVLLHFPRNARTEFQERYRGKLAWSRAEGPFRSWCEGRTGFPLVDAGMRQLRAEGWMHNRARLVVGSFLTKDLGIDWRWGERWFMRMLLDGDEANNNGNWQWIASVGTDPAPVYRRIYNPARQLSSYDPDGRYVRRHVPELADVPDKFLGEPWKMPEELQREVGCVIGVDYPEPIVDHAEARREALERYRVS
jgi:deoxyribodipyrimidine photo-lyase